MILEIFRNSFEYAFRDKKFLLKLGILSIPFLTIVTSRAISFMYNEDGLEE
jgi:hypothetical protein